MPALHRAIGDAICEGAQGFRIFRVRLDRLAQRHKGALVVGLGLAEIIGQGAQVEVIGG